MIGKTLGHYQITSQLGKGGMGEVFQAKDQVLGRDVAIKVLPEEFARDADRVARFQREAKLLASLNHPNIAAIYGLEESAGTNFLVLELVEGETLADRIRTGPIPVEESLKLALQIAEALEAAHEKGVIHRDLKPANIKVTSDGKVKVLDFGLAKAFAGEQSNVNLSNSPTLSELATQQGVILGTAAYMSPEQARGKAVDKRTDIWAFGVVLYEMLTGRQLFMGESVSDSMAAVLTKVPEWQLLPAGSPNSLLRRCLEKDPKRRLRDIGDAVLEPELATTPDPARPPVYRHPLMWALAVIAVAALAYALWNRPSSIPKAVVRLSIPLPPDQELTDSPAISPDGQTIAYISRRGTDEPQLYLRRLNSMESNSVAESAGASQPFFSPDGKRIAFFAHGQLFKAEVAGGSPKKVADAPYPFGGTWNEDGTIIFTAGLNSGLLRISANGGTPESLTKPDGAGKGYAHGWPQSLPDGHSVLFTIWGKEGGYAVLSLDSRQWQKVESGVVNGVFFLSAGSRGYLLCPDFNADLKAAPFDLAHPAVTSADTWVLSDVYVYERAAKSFLAVSKTGTAVYAPGNPSKRSLVWVGYDGKSESLGTPQARYSDYALAPDGMQVLACDWLELFICRLKQPGTRIPLTLRTASLMEANSFTLWSLDSKRIYFSSNRGGDWDIYSQPADGSQPAEVLLKRPYDEMPTSIGPDGTILFRRLHPTTGADIMALSSDGKDRPVLATAYNEDWASFSPDGQWIAYASDESGRYEVYVQKYPDGKKREAVSAGMGIGPRWSHDGNKVFYLSGDAMMMVPMRPDGTPASKPSKLFDCSGYKNTSYDISSDDKRFLMVRNDPGSVPRQLNVILNWSDELDEKVSRAKK